MNFTGLPNERAQALFRVIRDRWDESEAEGDWADCVHLSRFHFQRLFRRYFGETPGELRRRLRLERAAHHLYYYPARRDGDRLYRRVRQPRRVLAGIPPGVWPIAQSLPPFALPSSTPPRSQWRSH